MRNVPALPSLRSLLLALATVAASASLLGCVGDDTNPPLPDAGTPSDASIGDAAKATDGAAAPDSGSEADTGTATDSGTETDTGTATDAAAEQG